MLFTAAVFGKLVVHFRSFLTSPLFATPYHQTSRSTAFREFRKAINMLHIEFDHFRDGAYTAAARSRIDDKWARLLSGQRAAGLQDNYVLRHPEIVRPACDAVYAHYFGPTKASDT